MALSDEQIKKYVESGWGACPFCGGDVEGESVDIDGNTATQEVHCNECEAAWQDLYMLSGVIVLNEPERAGETQD